MPLSEHNMNLRLFTSLSPCENKHRCLLPTPLRWACCGNFPVRAILPLPAHIILSHLQIFLINLRGSQPFSSRKPSLWLSASMRSPLRPASCPFYWKCEILFLLMLPQMHPCIFISAQISALRAQTSSIADIATGKPQRKHLTLHSWSFPLQSGCIQCLTWVSIPRISFGLATLLPWKLHTNQVWLYSRLPNICKVHDIDST